MVAQRVVVVLDLGGAEAHHVQRVFDIDEKLRLNLNSMATPDRQKCASSNLIWKPRASWPVWLTALKLAHTGLDTRPLPHPGRQVGQPVEQAHQGRVGALAALCHDWRSVRPQAGTPGRGGDR